MRTRNALLLGFAAILAVALFIAMRSEVESPGQEVQTTPPPPRKTALPERPEEGVPAYHPTAESAQPLPQILPATLFAHPAVAKAYRVAQQIPSVLAQQPCYCYCDAMGHGSLVDCFATDHGAG